MASISSRYSSSTIVQLDASERGENPPEIIAIKNKARAVVGGGGCGRACHDPKYELRLLL